MMAVATPPPTEANDRDGMRAIYWALGAIVVVLIVIGLIVWNNQADNATAHSKAQELSQRFRQAGLPVPHQDILVNTLGDDGGAVCENPANALGKALLYDQLTNGADFVGRRPVIADHSAVAGEALILQTYCPDKLAEYKANILNLKLRDTVKP